MEAINMTLWRKIYNHKCLNKMKMIKRFMSWESNLGKLVACTYNPRTQEPETLDIKIMSSNLAWLWENLMTAWSV